MRALMMQRGKLWVDDLATPAPGPDELLVRSRGCGICGSDLHAVAHTDDFVRTSLEAGGAFKLTTHDPVVLGHEFCAEVVETGGSSGPTPGSLICSVPMLSRSSGAVPVGYHPQAPGGFAEYMLLSQSLVIPVPEGTPAHAAALTEPMAVGLHAVNKAELHGDEIALVIGCGPVGLAVITALRTRGAGPVIASDFSPGRRAVAQACDAHVVVDPNTEDPFKLEAVRSAVASGRRVVVFECVGVPGMIDQMFLACPQNARIVVVGVCIQTDHSRPLIAINKELNVQYVLGYNFDEFKQSLFDIADGKANVEHLISEVVSLDDAQDAFERLRQPDESAKILIDPSL